MSEAAANPTSNPVSDQRGTPESGQLVEARRRRRILIDLAASALTPAGHAIGVTACAAPCDLVMDHEDALGKSVAVLGPNATSAACTELR